MRSQHRRATQFMEIQALLIDFFRQRAQTGKDFCPVGTRIWQEPWDATSSALNRSKPASRSSGSQRFDTGIASAINLAGAFDHEFTQTPLAKPGLL
jgi:hypothetical protein